MLSADEAVPSLLDLTDDLALFQQDEAVQAALHRGVDLKKYGAELEKLLKEVSRPVRSLRLRD